MKRAGYYFVALIVALYLIILVSVLTEGNFDSIGLAVRMLGLSGLYFLTWAALMTPFLVEISRKFGTSFIRLHHAFAIVGLLSIISHAIMNSIQFSSLAVLIPSFDSLDVFLRRGGRLAIYIIIFATGVAVFRKGLGRSWRPLHAIIYVAFILAIIHGNLVGSDFRNPVIAIVFDGLFVATIGALVLKRYRKYSKRRKKASAKLEGSEPSRGEGTDSTSEPNEPLSKWRIALTTMAQNKSNSMLIAIIAAVVIVAIVAAIVLSGALNPASTNPEVSISSPEDQATVSGPNVTVTVAVSNFLIVNKLGQANVQGEGHVHFFKDVAVPTTPGVPAVTAPGTYAVTTSTTYTWTNVSAGTHNFSALLVNNDHTPLVPVVHETITVTVVLPAATVDRYLSAQNSLAFNVSTLSVPVGASVLLHFENAEDGEQHNFALYANSDHTGQLYLGSIITGVNSITYSFVAPATPGTYYFRCEIHPAMTGTLVVT